jgi:hypothetical protein
MTHVSERTMGQTHMQVLTEGMSCAHRQCCEWHGVFTWSRDRLHVWVMLLGSNPLLHPMSYSALTAMVSTSKSQSKLSLRLTGRIKP